MDENKINSIIDRFDTSITDFMDAINNLKNGMATSPFGNLDRKAQDVRDNFNNLNRELSNTNRRLTTFNDRLSTANSSFSAFNRKLDSATDKFNDINNELRDFLKTLKKANQASSGGTNNASSGGTSNIETLLNNVIYNGNSIRVYLDGVNSNINLGGGGGTRGGTGSGGNQLNPNYVPSGYTQTGQTFEKTKNDEGKIRQLLRGTVGLDVGDEFKNLYKKYIKGEELSPEAQYQERKRKFFKENGGWEYDNSIGKYKNGNKILNKKSEREGERLFAEQERDRERKRQAANEIGKIGFNAVTQGKNFDYHQGMDQASNALMKMGPWGMAAGSIMKVANAGLKMINEMQKPAQEYARTIGGGRRAMDDMVRSATVMVTKHKLTNRYLIEATDLMKTITQYQSEIGRAVDGTAEGWAAVNQIVEKFGVSIGQMDKLDTLGIGVDKVDQVFSAAYEHASRTGVAWSKMSKLLDQNLQMATRYSFKKGLSEIIRMTDRSAVLKLNMQQVANLADKVSNVEGSITTAANLSMLGGSYAQFASNPLEMMRLGLTDVGGLEEKLEDMISSKVSFSKEKGMLDMNPYERQRMLASAQAMGMDPNNLLDAAFRKAQGEITSRALVGKTRRGKGLNEEGNEGLLEYIQNKAQLNNKTGEAEIGIKNEEGDTIMKRVADLTEEELNTLKSQQDLSADSMLSIAEKTKTIDENVAGISSWLKGWATRALAKIAGFSDKERERDVNKFGISEAKWNAIDKVNRWGVGSGRANAALKEEWGISREQYENAKKAAIEKAKNDGDNKLAKLLNERYLEDERYQYLIPFLEAEAKKAKAEAQKNGTANPYKVDKYENGNVRIASGPSHANGGIPVMAYGHAANIEGGESIINKRSTAKYYDQLVKINNGTFADGSVPSLQIIETMFDKIQSMVVSATRVASMTSSTLKIAPLTINGTIKLDLGNQTTSIDSSKLLNNTVFISELTKILTKTLNAAQHSGDLKKDRPFKY